MNYEPPGTPPEERTPFISPSLLLESKISCEKILQFCPKLIREAQTANVRL